MELCSFLKLVRQHSIKFLFVSCFCFFVYIVLMFSSTIFSNEKIRHSLSDSLVSGRIVNYTKTYFGNIDYWSECAWSGAAMNLDVSLESIFKPVSYGNCDELKHYLLENKGGFVFDRFYFAESIILRPFLRFSSLESIRPVYEGLTIMLCAIFLWCIYTNLGAGCTFSFIIAFIPLHHMFASFFSSVVVGTPFLIALLSCVIILYCKKDNLGIIFSCLGSLVCLFNYSTSFFFSPALQLSIVYLVLVKQREPIRSIFKSLLICALGFCIGFGFLFLLKLSVSYFIFDRGDTVKYILGNVIGGAFNDNDLTFLKKYIVLDQHILWPSIVKSCAVVGVAYLFKVRSVRSEYIYINFLSVLPLSYLAMRMSFASWHANLWGTAIFYVPLLLLCLSIFSERDHIVSPH